MDEVYSEVVSKAQSMGFSSLSSSLRSLTDPQLSDLFSFLIQKYDSALWNGKDKSNVQIAKYGYVLLSIFYNLYYFLSINAGNNYFHTLFIIYLIM